MKKDAHRLIKPSIHKNVLSARLLSGKIPDFVIAGVYRCGTTSLFVNLAKHPDIEMSPNASQQMMLGNMENPKESHFFNERWDHGVQWYQSLFNNNGKLQGEAASKYLFKKVYIQRMASVIPQAKIIVALRNPVTRAYSQYEFFKKSFPDTVRLFHTQFRQDKKKYIRLVKSMDISFDETLRKEIKKGLKVGSGIIGKGLYGDMLLELFKHFPQNQILILMSEQMKKNMAATYKKIFDFLDVAQVKIDFQKDVHSSQYQNPMSRWAEATLKKIYRPYNESLFKLLGHDVPEWD
jgi:hypothetical protein